MVTKNKIEKARKMFLAQRLTGIGGSDAAAICGLSRFKKPIDVYLEKRGLSDPVPVTPQMEWGNRLEPVVIEKFEDTTGLIVVNRQLFRRSNLHSFMIAHFDGLIMNGKNGNSPIVFEAKTAGAYTAKDWGDAGTDEIPKEYNIQCQHMMEIAGAEKAYLAVLIGGNDFRIFNLFRNDELIKNLVKIENDFWKNVLNGIEPEIDSTDTWKKHLSAKYPQHEGELELQATPEIDKIINFLRQSTENKKDIDASIALRQNQIKDFMKDAPVIVGPDYRITWKKTKDSSKVNWEEVARELQRQFVELLSKTGQKYNEDAFDLLVKDKTKMKPGVRRFTSNFSFGGE